jgi:two-component system, LytTR family, response regulator LytT
MINCLIIDDDIVSVKIITHYISNTEGLSLIDAFTDPILGTNYIRKNASQIGLIFLDVEMPEMSGIELLESFQEMPPVILITSKENYAVKAFEHRVAHYLVKPIEYGKFLKAIDRVLQQNLADSSQDLDYIFIKENGILNKVMHTDILYFEALGDYVKVHTKEKVHVANSTMKNIEDKLKMKKQFIRIHRSFIINLNYLKNFDSESCYLSGNIIPIGNKYKAALQTLLNII